MLDSSGTQAATAIHCMLTTHRDIRTWNLALLPNTVTYNTMPVRTDSMIKEVKLSPNGHFVFLRDNWNGNAQLNNAQTRTVLPFVLENVLAHSLDLRFFICKSGLNTVLKDRENQDIVIFLDSEDDALTQAIFSKDGTFFITGSRSGKIQIWPLATYPQVAGHLVHAHTESIKLLEIAPTDDAASLSTDGEVSVFNTRNELTVNSFCIENSLGVKSLRLTDDGKTVLIVYKDGKTVARYLVGNSYISKELPRTVSRHRALTSQFIFCSDVNNAHVAVYHNPWYSTSNVSFSQLSLMLKVLGGQCKSSEEMRLGILNLLTHMPTSSVCRYIVRLLALQNTEFVQAIEKYISMHDMYKLKVGFCEELILRIHDDNEDMLEEQSKWQLTLLTLPDFAFALRKLNSLDPKTVASLAELETTEQIKLLSGKN